MPRDERGWQVMPAPDGRGMPEQARKRPPPHRRPGFLWFVLILIAVNWLSVLLSQKGVQITAKSTAKKPSLLVELLLGFGPTLLIVGLFVLVARRAAGGGAMGALGGFGRSRARRVDPDTIRVTFDDVAGIDEAKAELSEIVDFLKNPQRYQRLGGRMPHGVLLS